MGLFSKYISPKVSIVVSPDEIEFTKDDYSLSLLPLVYIVGHKIVSIGEEPDPQDKDAQLLNLFQISDYQNHRDRFSAMEILIKYGTIECLKSTSNLPLYPILKPVITFHNLESLDSILLGYQWMIFYEAAEKTATQILYNDA